MFEVPELPFPVVASHDDVWSRDDATGSIVAKAPGHTDFYVNPGGAGSADAESLANAATLLGVPPPGDFQLSARVAVDFRSQYDAGVLMVWVDGAHWAKLCFELSPAGRPMVVSVVTKDVSDDANAFEVDEPSVWLRVSRVDNVYAFHASADGMQWRLVRVFALGPAVGDDRVGLEVQAPTGDGCTVTYADLLFRQVRLADLRDGS